MKVGNICASISVTITDISNMISDYLNKAGINVISCYDLNNKESQRFISVRLCVLQCHLQHVMNPDMWPPGGPPLEVQNKTNS